MDGVVFGRRWDNWGRESCLSLGAGGAGVRSGLNMGSLPDLLLRGCPNSLLGTLDDKQVVTLQAPNKPDKSWQS